jgi:hypothetical protein
MIDPTIMLASGKSGNLSLDKFGLRLGFVSPSNLPAGKNRLQSSLLEM